ncbi:MAG: uroporphyrinogen decarboxylase family protein [Candidatus Poribacteria bacterium]
MAYEGLIDDIGTITNLGIPERVPVFALSEEFDVKWFNHGTYEEIISSADKLAECSIASAYEFGYDWVWLQIDDCIEFEPLGVGSRGSGNILRATCDYLPANEETLSALKMPNPKKDGRMPILLDAISKVRKEFGDNLCVCGRTAAPFSSASLLYGIEESFLLMLSDPDLLKRTCEFFIELQLIWGKAQFEAGAHALWVGDCNAMSNLISLAQYSKFAFEPCKELLQRFRDIAVLTFLHASEEKPEYIEKQAKIGADALSVGPGIDIGMAKQLTLGKIALIGNLDPLNILQRAIPQKVADETKRIMKIGKQGGGYIFNTGEMVPRDTPEENMRAMMRSAKCQEEVV